MDTDMSWMEFTLGLLDKLAWPLIVVFIILSLRKPIADLIPLAKRMKYKDFELEFGQELRAVTRTAAGEAFPELTQDKRARLIASADELPNATVLEAWSALADSARQLIQSRHQELVLDSSTPYKQLENILLSEALIDIKKGKLFSELRQLRNRVAHARGFEVGRAEALQYTELCFRLVDHLDGLLKDGCQIEPQNTSVQSATV